MGRVAAALGPIRAASSARPFIERRRVERLREAERVGCWAPCGAGQGGEGACLDKGNRGGIE